MLGGGSITLFWVRGIRIAVDWSWFLILFFLIFTMSRGYGDALGESSTAAAPFALAVASTLGFFASILLHELGHAFAALRHGIGISSIQLWIFGGVARMDRESDSPASRVRGRARRPGGDLCDRRRARLVGGAIVGAGEFAHVLRLAFELHTDGCVSGFVSMLAWLAAINAFVLVFNLLPAFPMDGGRIARALVWWRTGDRNLATRYAANLGRGFAYLFIAGGLVAGRPATSSPASGWR